MPLPTPVRHPQPSDLARIERLLDRAPRTDGSRPLSDHSWIDLQAGGGPGFVGLLLVDDDGSEIAWAQASSTNDARSIEIVVAPDASGGDSVTEQMLAATLGAIAENDGGTATWWVADATAAHEQIARRHGLLPDRELLQMRRPLPVDEPVTIATRPFHPGDDDVAWLDVNNRAFADHGEQGGWDLGQLRSRFAEPWFDPAGFLVHEVDGRLAGFCWTKLHHDVDPPLGEIYVVAVDPSLHGRGLGAQLTIAGLASIHARGIHTGLLYVDGDNTAAVGLYRRLGFTVHRSDRAFTGAVDARR